MNKHWDIGDLLSRRLSRIYRFSPLPLPQDCPHKNMSNALFSHCVSLDCENRCELWNRTLTAVMEDKL